MAKVLEIRDLADHIAMMSSQLHKATARALLRVAVGATTKAKRNARDNFKGTSDRPKTGNLTNSIFAGFETKGLGRGKVIAEAMVAVRSQKGNRGTRPYGRIHEYGGAILPVRAKWLWIPALGPKTKGGVGALKNMTPSDFIAAMITQQKTGKEATFGGITKPGTKRKRESPNKGKFAMFPAKGGGMTAWFTMAGRRGVVGSIYALFYLRKRVEMPARPYVTPAVGEEFPHFKDYLDEELLNDGSMPPDRG